MDNTLLDLPKEVSAVLQVVLEVSDTMMSILLSSALPQNLMKLGHNKRAMIDLPEKEVPGIT